MPKSLAEHSCPRIPDVSSTKPCSMLRSIGQDSAVEAVAAAGQISYVSA
jgi:hypothetical protein